MDSGLDRFSQLSPAKRELLQRALREKLARKPEVSVILRTPRREHIPLSFMQQRLWFLNQLEANNPFYNAANVQRLEGSLQAKVFEQSVQEIVQRHEILRTTFVSQGDHPVQIIAQYLHLTIPFIDLTHLTPSAREAEVLRIAREEAHRPFLLAVGPLLRMTLLRLQSHEHILLITLNHIICDGWSIEIFTRELSALYNAFLVGKPSPLSDLPIQYADFALWQHQWLQGEIVEQQLRYWTKQLGALTSLEFPTDYPRPAVQTHSGAHLNLMLPLSLHADLKRLSQHENVTLFMILLAAFQTLLARYTGQSDIAIGTDVVNRTRSEFEGLIGFFVNTLVLRSDLSGNPRFLDLLQRVREMALGAYAHQDVPFEKLVEVLQPQRDLSRSPLFQVFLSVQQAARSSQMPTLMLQGLKRSHLALESGVAKFDLNLTVTETEQGLSCVMEYNTNLFQASTITRLLQHFHTLLASIVRWPHRHLTHLPLLSQEERSQILIAWNATQTSYPHHSTLAALFAHQVARTPDRIAVACQDVQLSYACLHQRATQLAILLRKRGVGLESLVGIYLERSVEMLISILAVFQAGGAYAPLDPAYPSERLAFILDNAHLSVLITTRSLCPTLPVTNMALLCLEEYYTEEAHIEEDQTSTVGKLAYVIYTSGSTGQPKGVMVQQEGMLNHLFAKLDTLHISESDTIAQTASHCFDISVWQFLAGLLAGSRVHIFPDEVAHDPWQLWPQVEMQAISILELVPSLLHQLLDDRERTTLTSNVPLALRWLLATGEALSTPLAERWLARFSQIPLVNAYGPTECSDDVTHACIQQISLSQHSSLPIGRPLGNLQVYVLDAQKEPVPVGVVGEIYVGGIGVGRGYLNDPVHTAAAFVPNLYGKQAGERLYRTGDLGTYQIDGQIRFLGRIDEQVKLRGYRIELGEIKAQLQSHEQVGECEILVWEKSPGDRHLVAYVVGREQQPPTVAQLRSYLSGKLPDYMLPSFFVMLKALPVTPNGKIDRHALPAPEAPEEESRENYKGFFSPIEEIVTTVWKEVLKREQVARHDNFFAQGGHSLLATQVVARLRAILRVEIPLRSLFETPTVAGLSIQIEHVLRKKQGIDIPQLVPVSRNQSLPLSFAQMRLWLIDQVEAGNVAYNISYTLRLRGQLQVSILQKCLDEILQRHEILRTTFQSREDNPPVQVIAEHRYAYLALIDLRSLASEARETDAWKLIWQETQSPFNLARGPLLRTRIFRLGENEHVLQLTIHHIVADRWSQSIFSRELATLYQAFSQGKPSPLLPLALQYTDFAHWQHRWLQGEILDAHIAYWTKQLRGATPLELPTDRPRSLNPSTHGALHAFQLSTSLSAELMRLSRQEGVTLFMTLLAAFQILLYRYTQQQDIVVGTDIANRTSLETEGMIGFFINLLVLRTTLSSERTFHEVLQQVRNTVLDAYTHQDLPFEKLVEALRLERMINQVPLVRVLLVLENIEVAPLALPGLEVYQAEPSINTAKFDLAMFIEEGPEGLFGTVNYRSDLFDPSTIENLIKHFDILLHSIVAQPDQQVAALEMFSESERRQQTANEASGYETHRRKLKTTRRNMIALTPPTSKDLS